MGDWSADSETPAGKELVVEAQEKTKHKKALCPGQGWYRVRLGTWTGPAPGGRVGRSEEIHVHSTCRGVWRYHLQQWLRGRRLRPSLLLQLPSPRGTR